MNLHLLSVSVGRPCVIGIRNGEDVPSGIGKQRVTADSVHVGATNIDGDAQADLTVHGGVDKAVYVYPAANWPWWESEHRLACGPATFGENLTVEGADETQVAIGDRFRWGGVVLEISQPRGPCFKLGIHARPDVPQLMTLSARCGWYMRVVAAGEAPVHGAMLQRISSVDGPTVRDAFLAAVHPGISDAQRLQVRDAPALAGAWRAGIVHKMRQNLE